MKRLWCERLACGHIVAVLNDGTLLLCTLNYGHERHGEPCRFTGTIQFAGDHSAVSASPQGVQTRPAMPLLAAEQACPAQAAPAIHGGAQ